MRVAAAESSGSVATQTFTNWRTIGLLSVPRQRQKFRMFPFVGFAGCRRTWPTSFRRAGTWRAAPDAALHWAAEEFDFPRTARVGEGEAADPSAIVLSQPYGMRLRVSSSVRDDASGIHHPSQFNDTYS